MPHPCDALSGPMREICLGHRLTPAKRAAYIEHWVETGRLGPDALRLLPGPNKGVCAKRGEQVAEAPCGCASGGGATPIYACPTHGRCAEKQVAGAVWCRWCDDHEPLTAPTPDPAGPPS